MTKSPYGDHPYGGSPYGGPPYGGAPYPVAAPDHPQATTILVLGIIGLVACALTSPFAWVMGNRALREIDSSGGRIDGRSVVNAGRVCGIVGSVLLILGALFLALIITVAVVSPESFEDDNPPYEPYDPYDYDY